MELTADNAVEILAQHGFRIDGARARALGGGVSNTVIAVESPVDETTARRIIVKQSLSQLRVQDEWLADRSRILRERDVIEAFTDVLPAGRVPKILFADDADFLYAMEAAPSDALDWKTRLLAAESDPQTARQAGLTLGLMIRESWGRRDLRERFGDTRAFEQLRVDPYYRTIAKRHPAIAASVNDWIDEQASRQWAMVHGDWSPKNLLVSSSGLTAIDFECAHFGDPSYDAAFLTNHLLLKAFHKPPRCKEYFSLARTALTWTLAVLPTEALAAFEASAMRHLSFLMLARIDGKSPAEYLSEPVRDNVRQLAMQLIAERHARLDQVIHVVKQRGHC